MIISFKIQGRDFTIDSARSIDISIPLKFDGQQPNAYGVDKATSKPCEAGEMVGDTRRGGSCNFEQISLIPHCNGTHTEGVGHITKERLSVRECLNDVFIVAVLISIEPELANGSDEVYSIPFDEKDTVISRRLLEDALKTFASQSPRSGFLFNSENEDQTPNGLIIRTVPNSADKLSKTYLDEIPPFFTTEAMEYLSELAINHLLVDLPSIDRIFDSGNLSNHRIFWGVEQGSFELNSESKVNNTVTELIFVPDAVIDGVYLLNLQIAPFEADASPSRPAIFELIN